MWKPGVGRVRGRASGDGVVEDAKSALVVLLVQAHVHPSAVLLVEFLIGIPVALLQEGTHRIKLGEFEVTVSCCAAALRVKCMLPDAPRRNGCCWGVGDTCCVARSHTNLARRFPPTPMS